MPTVAPTTSYVRGAAPRELGRPLRTSLAVVGLATLLAFTVVLAVQARQQNARLDRLASAGVPVVAHVTHCVVLASGTGVTGAGVTCHAAFELDGRHYVAMLHANTKLRPEGAAVRAVTTRSNPSDLTVGTPRRASWSGYLLPGALFLVMVLTALTLVGRGRLRARLHSNTIVHPGDLVPAVTTRSDQSDLTVRR